MIFCFPTNSTSHFPRNFSKFPSIPNERMSFVENRCAKFIDVPAMSPIPSIRIDWCQAIDMYSLPEWWAVIVAGLEQIPDASGHATSDSERVVAWRGWSGVVCWIDTVSWFRDATQVQTCATELRLPLLWQLVLRLVSSVLFSPSSSSSLSPRFLLSSLLYTALQYPKQAAKYWSFLGEGRRERDQ